MSDKFIQQQRVEREQLRRLLKTMRPLLVRSRETAPTDIELAALATFLHGFYTGTENILKRASLEIDGRRMAGEHWHRDLLHSMAEPGELRPALLSLESRLRLAEYLAFRHVFRNAYSFDLDWNKMRALVLGAEELFTQLEVELDQFIERL